MFIVYSPEGQSFIGVPPPRPELKVDPVHPVRSIESFEKEPYPQAEERIQAEQAAGNPHSHHLHHSLSAYEETKEAAPKKVVTLVREIMSFPVITLEIEATFQQAWERMQNSGVQALPIMQETHLVGVVTESMLLTQLMNHVEQRIETILPTPIQDIMQKQVITTVPQTEIRRVAAVMHLYQVHALPVMSEVGEMVGIVTRSDLIERLAEPPPIELYV